MKTIHKFRLYIIDQDIDMPKGARPVFIEEQHGIPQLWAEVDTERPVCSRSILCRGTGQETPKNAVHIGSVLCNGGALVWHYYDEGEKNR